MPVGLPKSSRVDRTSEEIGFHWAMGCSHAGIAVIGTKALDRKVSGKSHTRPAVWAVSGFGM